MTPLDLLGKYHKKTNHSIASRAAAHTKHYLLNYKENKNEQKNKQQQQQQQQQQKKNYSVKEIYSHVIQPSTEVLLGPSSQSHRAMNIHRAKFTVSTISYTFQSLIDGPCYCI